MHPAQRVLGPDRPEGLGRLLLEEPALLSEPSRLDAERVLGCIEAEEGGPYGGHE